MIYFEPQIRTVRFKQNIGISCNSLCASDK